MRRELVAIALAASPAAADVRGLVAADGYFAGTPHTTDVADVAWSAHVDWREVERGAVFDWVERESLIGSPPRRELHELAYTERSLDPLAITVGRFRVPGGFWLIADGAAVTARGNVLELSAFGGSRSFTNARTETLLTASPSPLPLVGAAITTRGDIQTALSYTYTSDRVVLYRGLGEMDSMTEPEQFADAEVLAAIGDDVYVTAGATMGSRYLVTYPTDAARIADDPRLENVWFGSQAAYALADWRLGEWRLDAGAAALHTKLGAGAEDNGAFASITGSFVEGTLRANWRRDRTWRVDARYRARVWADRRMAHRGQVASVWQHDALVVEASAGVDVHRNPRMVPGFTKSTSLLYRASVGRKTEGSELAIGAAAVSSIGDEAPAGPDDTADARAPYTLEARSYAFVRAFARSGAWFGGLDGEVDFTGGGVRTLLQIGCAR
jgi:hypothetical protein